MVILFMGVFIFSCSKIEPLFFLRACLNFGLTLDLGKL